MARADGTITAHCPAGAVHPLCNVNSAAVHTPSTATAPRAQGNVNNAKA